MSFPNQSKKKSCLSLPFCGRWSKLLLQSNSLMRLRKETKCVIHVSLLSLSSSLSVWKYRETISFLWLVWNRQKNSIWFLPFGTLLSRSHSTSSLLLALTLSMSHSSIPDNSVIKFVMSSLEHDLRVDKSGSWFWFCPCPSPFSSPPSSFPSPFFS